MVFGSCWESSQVLCADLPHHVRWHLQLWASQSVSQACMMHEKRVHIFVGLIASMLLEGNSGITRMNVLQIAKSIMHVFK